MIAGAEQGHRRDALVEDQPAERDRDDRVDVGVGGDLRDRRVLEQPRVAREGQQRAERDQVDEPKIERPDHSPGWTSPASPATKPTATMTRPPSRLCQAVETSGSRGRLMRGDANEPVGPHDRAADAGQQADDRGLALGLEQQRDAARSRRAPRRGCAARRARPRRGAGGSPTAGPRRSAARPGPTGPSARRR